MGFSWFKPSQKSDEVGDVAQSVYQELPPVVPICVECGVVTVSVEGFTCRDCIFKYAMEQLARMKNERIASDKNLTGRIKGL